MHERRGGGTPVLFWHGLGTDGSGSALRIADALAGRRLIAPDAPGFGASPVPGAFRYTGAELAAVSAELLDALDVERVVFVGESWGAWVGCHAVAASPGRFAALVLLDGAYTELRDWPDTELPSLAECTELAHERGVLRPESWAAAFRATLRPPPVSAAYAGLRDAAVPVLLLAAGEDGADAATAARTGLARFRAALPAAEVHVLERVGHDVLADEGARRLLADRLSRYA